jgi:dolichol kinase
MEQLLVLTDRVYNSRIGRQLRTELIRKAIHLLIALVPLLAAIDVGLTMGLLGAGTLFYIFAENARRHGVSILLVSDLTVVASREQDRGRFVLGPVTLGIGAMLALLLYPGKASIIAIYALAFGDSAASLVGKSVGGLRIPFANGKTFAGTFACFFVVLIVAYRLTGDWTTSFVVGTATALFEVFPTTDMDNIIIPVGTGFVAHHLLVL